MKRANEFIEDFMRTWKNMQKYQNVDMTNYTEVEKAFEEEKKIVSTIKLEQETKKPLLEQKDDEWER